MQALVAFVAAFVVYALRRPDILLDPKLWAEDGQVWLTQAYALGPRALLTPHTGYLQTFSRLVFGAGSFLPLEFVPLFANLVGLAVRSAVVAFLCSRRFDWMGNARFGIALFAVFMPGLDEVHANITNTHWYLGLCLLLLALAPYPSNKLQMFTDVAAAIVSSLSGPFSIFALPAFMLRDLAHRRLHSITVLVGLAAALQVALIVWHAGPRASAPLGASADMFVRMLAARVYLGSILPDATADVLTARPGMAWAISVVGSALLVWGALKGGWRSSGAIAFVVLLVAATLISPQASLTEPQWPLLFAAHDLRYWVAPAIVLVGLALMSQRHHPAILLVLIGVAVAPGLLSFRIPPVPGPSFDLTSYYAAPRDTLVTIPIAPPGWILRAPAPATARQQ